MGMSTMLLWKDTNSGPYTQNQSGRVFSGLSGPLILELLEAYLYSHLAGCSCDFCSNFRKCLAEIKFEYNSHSEYLGAKMHTYSCYLHPSHPCYCTPQSRDRDEREKRATELYNTPKVGDVTPKVGDVVQLKTGSIQMTLDHIQEDKTTAVCVWWTGEEFKSRFFAITSLVKVK